jgi:hypothetical protein
MKSLEQALAFVFHGWQRKPGQFKFVKTIQGEASSFLFWIDISPFCSQ